MSLPPDSAVLDDANTVDQSPAAAGIRLARRGGLSRIESMLLMAPILLVLGWALLLPMGRLLIRSVTDPELTLQHYARMISEPLYVRTILVTARIAILTTAICLLLAYPIAILMTRVKGWTAILVAGCVFVPLWTSVLIRSYGWIVLLRRNGLINNFLQTLGITHEPLRMLFTEGAILVAMSHVLLPFMILPIYSTLRNIPPDLNKAALNLGAGPIRAFALVMLPLSIPGVFAGCILVFVLALGFYVTPALVGGAQTLMIATLIGQQATQALNWPFAAALSFVLLGFSLGITVVFKRLLRVEKLVSYD